MEAGDNRPPLSVASCTWRLAAGGRSPAQRPAPLADPSPLGPLAAPSRAVPTAARHVPRPPAAQPGDVVTPGREPEPRRASLGVGADTIVVVAVVVVVVVVVGCLVSFVEQPVGVEEAAARALGRRRAVGEAPNLRGKQRRYCQAAKTYPPIGRGRPRLAEARGYPKLDLALVGRAGG